MSAADDRRGEYDPAGKELIEFDPAGWLTFLGEPRPADRVSLIDADLSGTVTTATDKVIRVDDPEPWLVMAELHTYWDGDLQFLLLQRFAMLRRRHRLPVSMVVVLMRPEANARALTGEFVQPDRLNGDWPVRYKVVKLWETSVDTFLSGPLGLLPLAPLASFDDTEAPRVKAVIAERLQREASPADGVLLQTILFQLLGLRYDEGGIGFWSDLMNVAEFRQNYFGKLLISEGRTEGRRETLLEQGTDKFGPPSETVAAAISGMTDEAELRRLAKRLLHVHSWDELLAG